MTLRMRVLPRFPAAISAINGLKVTRPTGSPNLIVEPDFGSLVQIPSVDDPANVFFWAWDRSLSLYRIMSFADLFAGVADLGFMTEAVYDPQNIHADAFARANQTGTQAISTVSGLQAALDAKLALAGGAMAGTLNMNANAITNPAGLFLSGFLNGLTLSNNASDATNDIDIAAGSAASDGATPVLMTLASGLTKRLDAAWAVGTNQGGLDTGSIANTTYHVWLIQRSDTGVVDALFSTSATSPTMPASYDRKRRIGAIRRVGATIVPFYQNGDYFYLQTPVIDIAANNPGTSAVLRTISVPAGVIVKAIIGVGLDNNAAAVGFLVYISSPNVSDVAASTINANVEPAATIAGRSTSTRSVLEVDTNTSAQIRSRASASDASCFLNITTYGWIDTRGRV